VVRRRDRWRGDYRLAASFLLVAAAALGAWALHLRGTVAELSRPQANVALVELAPLEPATRLRDVPGEEAEVPAWADRVLLILDLGPPLPYTTYAVRIANREGAEVWSQQGLRRSPDGQFTLELPRRLLPPGAYRVQLDGVQGETRTPVAAYLMNLRAGGGS
jgi:guanyl-specific ribonuclease Sa